MIVSNRAEGAPGPDDFQTTNREGAPGPSHLGTGEGCAHRHRNRPDQPSTLLPLPRHATVINKLVSFTSLHLAVTVAGPTYPPSRPGTLRRCARGGFAFPLSLCGCRVRPHAGAQPSTGQRARTRRCYSEAVQARSNCRLQCDAGKGHSGKLTITTSMSRRTRSSSRSSVTSIATRSCAASSQIPKTGRGPASAIINAACAEP